MDSASSLGTTIEVATLGRTRHALLNRRCTTYARVLGAARDSVTCLGALVWAHGLFEVRTPCSCRYLERIRSQISFAVCFLPVASFPKEPPLIYTPCRLLESRCSAREGWRDASILSSLAPAQPTLTIAPAKFSPVPSKFSGPFPNLAEQDPTRSCSQTKVRPSVRGRLGGGSGGVSNGVRGQPAHHHGCLPRGLTLSSG